MVRFSQYWMEQNVRTTGPSLNFESSASSVHGSRSSAVRDYGSIEMTVTDRDATVSESLPF